MNRITRDTRHFQTDIIELDVSNDSIEWDSGVYASSVTQVGSHAFLLGGSTPAQHGARKHELCQLDLDTFELSCSRMDSTLPRLSSHNTFLVDDCLIVLNLDEERTTKVFKIDLLLRTCDQLEIWSRPPCDLENVVCEFIEASRQVVFFGGMGADTEYTPLNLVFTFDEATREWSTLHPTGTSPCVRDGHASCSVSNSRETTIFIFGGRSETDFLNDLHALHCAGRKYRWSQLRIEPSVQRVAFASMAYLSGMIFIYGGFSDSEDEVNQLIRYDVLDGTCVILEQSSVYVEASSFHTMLAVEGIGSILSFDGRGRDLAEIRVLRAKS